MLPENPGALTRRVATTFLHPTARGGAAFHKLGLGMSTAGALVGISELAPISGRARLAGSQRRPAVACNATNPRNTR